MLPLMCLPTQPPADPLRIPGPAEVPAPHLFCLSPWSGPGAPSQTPSGCDGHKPEGPRLARATQPARLTAPNTHSWPCWRTPQQGGELWAGGLLPVVQATLRAKGTPETPSNSIHWRVWQSIIVTIAISSLLGASVFSSVKVTVVTPTSKGKEEAVRGGHSTPQNPHVAFSQGTFESVGSDSPICVFQSVTKIKYQKLSTIYHFYRLRADLRRLPQQHPFHRWLSDLPSWVARKRQSIEGAGMVGVPGEPARSCTASTQPPAPRSSRAAPW